MKIEKINDNKIRITLTFDELEKRKISLNDIEKDSTLAKELLFNLLEESNLENDFMTDDSHLFIEASYDNSNLFIVTITKIDNIPELKKYSTLKEENSNPRLAKYSSYTVSSYIYSFESLDIILNLCQIASKENLFFGKNSLYKYGDVYFIIFSKATVKNKKFLKTFVFLSEYCKQYSSYNLFETSITEKAQLILKNNALQKLSKI
jgi:adapter protein MecA 1/2